jgi:tripartite motif-containing protein 71
VHARQATSASSTATIAPRSDAAAVSVCLAASLSPAALHVTRACVLVSCRQAGVRLADGFRGEQSRIIETPGVVSHSNGVAVSRDGSTLLVSDFGGGSHAIHTFRVADGSRLRVIGGAGDGPLQFKSPRQVWVASDDFAFVADAGNNRVQVLTPTLDFHAFVGVGQLVSPAGVCADDDVIIVSELDGSRISVFRRGDGALLRRFGSKGSGDGQLNCPDGLCFMSGHRHVAVADWSRGSDRISVFSVGGEFVRHVGVGKLRYPTGVACSAFDELVVADYGHDRVVVFSASGELLKTMGSGRFSGVTIHGGTIFAQDWNNAKCNLFK